MRGRRVSFQRAVAASVVLHALLVGGVVIFVGWTAARSESEKPPGIDTRVDQPPSFPLSEPIRTAALPSPVPSPAPSPVPSTPPTGARPEVPRIPATLPREILVLLRRPARTSSDVVEVPLVATPLQPQQPNNPGAAGVRAAAFTGGQPVHGALQSGQVVVYVLDRSGSMGEWGKFDAARAALVATLREQPRTVRFQVVVYDATAVMPVRFPGGGCVPATAVNIDRVANALQELGDPAGRSNHAEGLRAALTLRPDFVLIFTDAEDLRADHVRGALAVAVKPTTVCVARVGMNGVRSPTRLK